jgi:hypothetical protein
MHVPIRNSNASRWIRILTLVSVCRVSQRHVQLEMTSRHLSRNASVADQHRILSDLIKTISHSRSEEVVTR